MKRRAFQIAGFASAALFVSAVGWGLAYSWVAEARLPSPDMRYLPRIEALIEAGELEAAGHELYVASKIDWGNDGLLALMARVGEESGDTRNAVYALRRLLLNHPDNPDLRLRYARAVLARVREGGRGERLARRQLPQALASAELAVRHWPDSAEAHAAVGETLLQLGEPDRALRSLEEALRLDPGLETARRDLAQARAEVGAT